MWNPIKGGDEMKKPLKYVGAVLGGGFAAVYAGLYYRAMHPKCPKPDKSRKRIACVGDSITYGYGFMGAFRKYCYPNQLQELLGNSYQVMNFGICDRTLQDQADKPYRQEKIYAASLVSEPNTVIIMLGTNDAKPANWNAERYENDLRSYVSVYRDLPSVPNVILMQPPKTFFLLGKKLDDIMDAAIGGEMHDSIARVGKESGCPVVDLYHLTGNHREWFVDGIHPNKNGARMIAEAVKKAL